MVEPGFKPMLSGFSTDAVYHYVIVSPNNTFGDQWSFSTIEECLFNVFALVLKIIEINF